MDKDMNIVCDNDKDMNIVCDNDKDMNIVCDNDKDMNICNNDKDMNIVCDNDKDMNIVCDNDKDMNICNNDKDMNICDNSVNVIKSDYMYDKHCDEEVKTIDDGDCRISFSTNPPPKPARVSLPSSSITTTTLTRTTAIASAIKRNSEESVLSEEVRIQMRNIGEINDDDHLYTHLDDNNNNNNNNNRFLSVAIPLEEGDDRTKDKKKKKSIIGKSKKFIYRTLFGEEKVSLKLDNDNNNDNNDNNNDNNDNNNNESLNNIEFVRSRKLLPFIIKSHPEIHDYYLAVLTLKQPNIGPNNYTPQGNRSDQIPIMASVSIEICQAAAESLSGPIWLGENDNEKHCMICRYSFAMLRKPHHCRNCGYFVCTDCSSKPGWPSDMLPSTFHFNEKFVRICDNCNLLADAFMDSLRCGDYEISLAIYATGNINITVPYSKYVTCDYPIHAAAEGGNLEQFKWLVEKKFCPLFINDYSSSLEESPLLNAKKESCLAIAAKFGNIEIMRYLIQEKGCAVSEITNLNIALRGLHCLLESKGPLPSVGLIDSFDHFSDHSDKGDRRSSQYAVAIDSTNNNVKNLPIADCNEDGIFPLKDRRPQINIRCKRKNISDRSYRQCLNTVKNNINLYSIEMNKIE